MTSITPHLLQDAHHDPVRAVDNLWANGGDMLRRKAFKLTNCSSSGPIALRRTLALLLFATLSGCHWDLFGGDSSDRAAAIPAASFSVGGKVSGLASGGMFTLLNNNADSLGIAADGAFTFTTALDANAGYAVSVGTEPTGQACTVTGGTGTIGTANINNVMVACSDQTYSLGGVVQGLSGTGLVLANGGTTLSVPSGAQTFTFPNAIAFGSSYGISVRAQPTGLVCVVSAGSGFMPANPIASIVVSCTPQTFTIGGTITGLGSFTGIVLANGTDTLAIPANATSFTMPASVGIGAPYSVAIAQPSPAMNCSVANGSGVIPAANVTNIAVTCTPRVASVLHSFAGPPSDGDNPWWGTLLLAKDGNFYGMTYQGGSNDLGAVFKVTPAGVETLLWSFGNGNDGNSPYGSLIQGSDGNFYGMTNLGGLYARGTVFKITPAGVESVLWSFGGTNDGAYPFGSLIEGSDGNFYGTAYVTVANISCGTVFRITPAGVETVLWTFGNGTDGQFPYGTLIFGADGNFYGLTDGGGVNGKGTIFRITPAGAETVLWSFGGSGDGAVPFSKLTLATDGNFYGLTLEGGANSWGTIFKFTPDGTETVLHSFTGGADGGQPEGSLLEGSDGNFYGTAEFGGMTGNGNIFQVTPGGAVTLLWSFGSSATDGSVPRGDLILGPGGALYCMTEGGGVNNLGAVVVFK
jgi:uncharacterized repeat protein (TIGR03803 family)